MFICNGFGVRKRLDRDSFRNFVNNVNLHVLQFHEAYHFAFSKMYTIVLVLIVQNDDVILLNTPN